VRKNKYTPVCTGEVLQQCEVNSQDAELIKLSIRCIDESLIKPSRLYTDTGSGYAQSQMIMYDILFQYVGLLLIMYCFNSLAYC